jgi:hypothetical protein
MIELSYGFIALFLLGLFVFFRLIAFVFGAVIKLAFITAFLSLAVLAMSSSVGLF